MFEFIHHVRILVHDADAMAAYIADNFGLTPGENPGVPRARDEKRHLQSRRHEC